MNNDEFETNGNAGGNDHYRSNHKKPYSNSDDHPHNRSRDRQRTTAIALSVITCLFMCVIGYEIVRENNTKHEDIQSVKEAPKPSLLLSKISYSNHQYLDDDLSDEDSYESHQIRLLQEQNRKQANKIKGLRQELLEKMQAMHEIKANLFKQEGDPRDKAKIDDLSQRLEEKEKVAYQLAANMKLIELDLTTLQRKIEHSEVTRDALASMIETQRAAKDQERIIAQRQIEKLQKENADESTELKAIIAELEKSQSQLDVAYQDKVEALEKANQDLANHYDIHKAKTEEHEALADLYHQTRENMSQQILDLVATLEWEAGSKAQIKKTLQNALIAQNLEKDSIITLLEAELQKRNEAIALFKAEENLHRNPMGYTAKEAQNQLLDLIATLEFEMTRTSFLQQEMDRSLYLNKQALGQNQESVNALEHELKKQKILLESKSDELTNLMTVLQLTREEHSEKLSSLMSSHQYESFKADQYEKELLANNEEKELLTKQLMDTQQKVTELKNKNNQALLQLSDHEQYHLYASNDLVQKHENTRTEFEQRLQDQEQFHVEARNEKIQELEQIIADLKNQSEKSLQDQEQFHIEARNAKVQELEQTIADLKNQSEGQEQFHIEARNAKVQELEQIIADLKNQSEDQEQFHVEARNAKVQELEQIIADLKNQSEDQEQFHIEARNAKVQELEQIIADLKNQSEKNLQDQEQFHVEARNAKVQELEQIIADLKNDSEKRLQDQEQFHVDTRNTHVQELEEVIAELRKEIESKDTVLAARQLELQALMTTEAQSVELLRQQGAELTHQIETGNVQLANMHQEIQSLIPHKEAYGQQLEKIKEFEDAVSALNQNLAIKEMELAERQTELESYVHSQSQTDQQLRNHIHDLTLQLEKDSTRLHQVELELQNAANLKTDHAANIERLNTLEEIAQNFKQQLGEKEEALASSQHELANQNHAQVQSEQALKAQILELEHNLEQQSSKLSALQNELYNATLVHQDNEENTQQINAKLQQTISRTSQLEEKIKAYHDSLAAKEHEIEKLIESKEVAEQNLNALIDDLHAQISHEKFKAETIQHKFKERQSQQEASASQVQDFEGQLSQLNQQLYQKEKELQATEEKLLLTLPQLEMLITENQHLHNHHEIKESKIQEATSLIQEQQKQLNELVNNLEKEQKIYQETISRYENQRKQGNDAAKKLELATLKATLLEDQLTVNYAEQKQRDEKISSLEHSHTELKNNYERKLDNLRQNLSSEKDKTQEITQNNKQLANLAKIQKQQAEELNHALEDSTTKVSQLEQEIRRLNNSTLAEFQKNLEIEKQKNKAIEADLKRVISAYNTDRQKQKKNDQPVADNAQRSN